jgi:hypothetical protein
MIPDPNDVVRVAAGDLVTIEMYQRGLKEAGIESKVVGEALEASFGTAIPQSIELWVHRTDAEKAAAAIRTIEEERGHRPRDHQEHGRPVSDPKPGQHGGHGPHTHYNPDPRS